MIFHERLALFLSSLIRYLVSFQLPTNLLRAGRVFVFEPPPGVPANLMRTFSTVPAARMCKVCTEKKEFLSS